MRKMDKQTALGFIVIVLLIVGVAFLIVSHMKQPLQPTPYKTPNNTNHETIQNESKTYPVNIQNLTFSPFEITINKGDIITWNNKDDSLHTITSDSGRELNSPVLKKDEMFTHKFDIPGIYNYHCEIRPNMKCRIIVM